MLIGNKPNVVFKTVKILVPGTELQGPDVAIPDDFYVAVRVRSTLAAAPKGYVAASAADTADATKRAEFLKGEGTLLKITNMNLLWFDSDTADTVFELIAEQR